MPNMDATMCAVGRRHAVMTGRDVEGEHMKKLGKQTVLGQWAG